MRTTCNQSVPTVIVVGPPPTLIGGMASVVQQILSLDLNGYYRTEAFPTTHSTSGAESFYRRVIRHVRHLRRLSAVVGQAGPTIVHIHTCSGFNLHRAAMDMLVARRAGGKTILHIHGAAFDKFHAQAGILGRRMIAWFLTRADRVVALSERWRDKLLEMAPKAKVTVVENAISIPTVDPIQEHDGPCRFLLMAKMDDWKGIDDLLDAAAYLRAGDCDFELVLAGPPGTAGDAAGLGAKIRNNDLTGQVRYVGTVEGEEKAALFRWADVYVQPSHHEGLPISMLEALVHGLPVVATNVGACPEVITDGREGVLLSPHRPDRLAATMYALACNPLRRHAMGLAASELASTRFSLDRFRNDLLSLYEEVIPCPSLARRTPPRETRETGSMDKPAAAHALAKESKHTAQEHSVDTAEVNRA